MALYRAADVMLVTPLRDGMNLVAKEFVASRTDDDGVLVLSEFAGAAWELPEALQVNPYDVEGAAEVYYRALTMPREERRARLRTAPDPGAHLRRSPLGGLVPRAPRGDHAGGAAPRRDGRPCGLGPREPSRAELAETDALLLLLDYDGTLVPFARDAGARPAGRRAAEPAARARGAAGHRGPPGERPAARDARGMARAIFRSGCTPSTGSVSRDPATRSGWRPASLAGAGASPYWPCCARSPQRTPGSLVEVKAAALAWHYRMADPEIGARRANELRLHLNQLLSNQPVEILAGNRMIEIRPHGVHKGRIVPPLTPERLAGTAMVAIGDDRTDEDLFAALPPEAITIKVGPGDTKARFRVEGVAAVRQILQSLVDVGVGVGVERG